MYHITGAVMQANAKSIQLPPGSSEDYRGLFTPALTGRDRRRGVDGTGTLGHQAARLRARTSTTLPWSFGALRSPAATSGTARAAALGAALPLTADMPR